MNDLTITGQYRDINTITQAFRFTAAQAQRMALTYVIQMGQLLTEAKELLNDRAEFERWLAEEAECKKSTAYNYMRIATEYGGAQVDLFGSVSNASMEKLTYSQAVALLAMPEEEREEFVDQHDMESMSTRELKQAIAERDAAKAEMAAERKRREKAESALKDTSEEILTLQNELEEEKANRPDVSGLEKQVQTAVENSKRLEKSLEIAQNDTISVQKSLDEALVREKKLGAELQAAKENPEIPLATLEKVSAEAADQAKKEYAEKLATLEAQQEEAKAETERLRKQLAQSNEEVTICRTYLTDVTTMLNKVSAIVMKVQNRDPETAEKLKGAVKSILMQYIEKM